MRNIRLTVSYDGTNYRGWQIQQKHPKELGAEKTIQGVIEKVLEKILQEEIRLTGAGRTDAGVHAKAQVANFKTVSSMPAITIKKALNALLPKDIAITDIKKAGPDFSARFDALSKAYRYTIFNRSSNCVFGRFYQYHIPYKLGIALMKREARALKGRHNFASFQASDKREGPPVRSIKYISVKKEGPVINIDVEGDGFLYNMVRNIAGTLIEIGRGKFPKGSMARILRAKDRRLAGPTAPARGLCLVNVTYQGK